MLFLCNTISAARVLSISALAITTSLISGCGGGAQQPSTGFSGNTTVTVLATGTANDQLSQFNINFTSVALTSQAGQTATLLTPPTTVEFMHLNGAAEPLATASVPQGVYTSATAIIGNSGFVCIANVLSANSVYVSTYAYGSTPPSQVTVTLPAPITVTGAAMVLSLDMLVSKSATYSSCAETSPSDTYSINPTFNLAPITLESPQANIQNGKFTGLDGLIASVDTTGSGFSVAAADGDLCVPPTGQVCQPGTANGPVWQVTSNGSTVFQGVGGFSALAAGMPVDIDATIQQDGSLVATRVAVADTNITNLSVFSGPLLQVASSEPVAYLFGREQQGYLFGIGPGVGPGYFSFGSATFQISSQFTNLENLPFSATFSAATIFAGQNVSYTTNAPTDPGGPTYDSAATVTLIPQTINGTVSAVSGDGGFDTYTVTIAPYDLVQNLAVQPGQTTALTNPGSIVVYADSNTQMLATNPPAVGSVLRFNGLLFNDHGTAKMDCAWIGDGVPE